MKTHFLLLLAAVGAGAYLVGKSQGTTAQKALDAANQNPLAQAAGVPNPLGTIGQSWAQQNLGGG